MKTNVSEYDFTNAFMQSDSRNEQFSYGALKAIYAYITDNEDEEHETELDIVAVCCEWSEYDSALEAMQDRGADLSELNVDWLDAEQAEDEELIEAEARQWLEERTIVLDVQNVDLEAESFAYINSIVIAQF